MSDFIGSNVPDLRPEIEAIHERLDKTEKALRLIVSAIKDLKDGDKNNVLMGHVIEIKKTIDAMRRIKL